MTDGAVAVSWREFFGRAARLAERLASAGRVVNLCEGRFAFTLGYVAALIAGRVSVLPPVTAGVAAAAVSDEPGTLVLSDQNRAGSAVGMIDPGEIPPGGWPRVNDVPSIEDALDACIVFSSGSTAEATAHTKSWGRLARVGIDIGERFGFRIGGQSVIGSVPSRHMFGLETTVLAPLQWGSVIHSGRPFLPGDVDVACQAVPLERWLMTTPIQLRALADDSLCKARFEAVISATMPLAAPLAAQVEERFGARVYEIYGCTEAGSLATRRTTGTATWHTLRDVSIVERDGTAWVSGGHCTVPTPLADIVSVEDPAHFTLLGRASHMVKVGGKRTSIEALNSVLTQLPGVRDGTFFFPDEDDGAGSRLVAFAVAPGVSAATLVAGLRSRIDPVFVPRPLYVVPQLPRNLLGKLSRGELAEMADRLSGRRDAVRG